MKNEIVIPSPQGDYELLDFGRGRKLERFGAYVIERPAPQATGARTLENWEPDWVYGRFAATESWKPQKEGLPEQWQIRLGEQTCIVRLGQDGELGIKPEQIACAEWVRQQLSGCYHMEEIRVLNLFGGYGSVSSAALESGARVTHLDPVEDHLDIARQNLGEKDIEYLHEDPHIFTDYALREERKYDMIVLRPSRHQRKGVLKQSWDIKVDLLPLVQKLPRLLNQVCQGIWLAPRIQDKSIEGLLEMLREILPGRVLQGFEIYLATRDGRKMLADIAASVHDEEEEMSLDGKRPPLNAAKLEDRLDVALDPMLSSGYPLTGLARALEKFDREKQEFVLQWVEVMARTNAGMAFQFATYVPEALKQMDMEEVRQWLLKAMDAFDNNGLYPAIEILKDVNGYADACRAKQTGVALDEVINVLEIFVQGLNGRSLKIADAERPYTDTETLYLPQQLNRFPQRERNFQLYKLMVVHQWAQCWFGTWRFKLAEALSDYPDQHRAIQWFHALEAIRLDACIQRMLPGVYRIQQELVALSGDLLPLRENELVSVLRVPGASAADTLRLLPRFYNSSETPPVACYQGVLKPEAVHLVREKRLAKERDTLRRALYRLKDEILGQGNNRESLSTRETGKQELELAAQMNEETGELEIEFSLDGQPMPPPDEIRAIASSIYQDLGEIPPEYLVAAGQGAYRPGGSEEEEDKGGWKDPTREEGVFLYNEWDCKRQSYRKNWCVLREQVVSPDTLEFIQEALSKHRGLVHDIRRTFEILRGEDKLLKKQPYGEDVDIDALVEAYGDVCSGLEMDDRLYTKKHKIERNIAVMFMVDMSGSTKGWINDAERESLILLCEALEILGDRYAIYGFSGMTRNRCELYRIKRFDEPYDETVQGRICGIQPKDYTRMGVTIRHLAELLNQVEARTKLLITLSDGKPDDFDGYRGEYGIEDTRQALIEAKRMGIHPFCITIDTDAHDYLPHMYGAVNYTVIDEVRKLPLKVSDIYRRLTS